jgi:hypothetical protein
VAANPACRTVRRKAFAPFADRSKRQWLTPRAGGERHYAIANPHRLEPPSGGRIGLPYQNDATRLERVDGSRQQRILIVRQHHVQHVEE